MDSEFMKSYGIDTDKGLKNCMGDVVFYKKILSMFVRDKCFSRAEAAYAAGDREALFGCMHELKGTSGNAALTGIFQATIPIVELLRKGEPAEEDVSRMFETVRSAYLRTCEGIAMILSES